MDESVNHFQREIRDSIASDHLSDITFGRMHPTVRALCAKNPTRKRYEMQETVIPKEIKNGGSALSSRRKG